MPDFQKTKPLPVIIDTDPGVDDALALLLALRSRELDVRALCTVCGNVDVHRATRNLCTVLNLLPGPYPPLAQGAKHPLQRTLCTAGHIHGTDGLGGRTTSQPVPQDPKEKVLPLSRRDAADEILHHIAGSSEALTLIALGPLTNIALALQRDRQLVHRIQELIVMGGAYTQAGNITPAAEFNIFVDPEAAQEVFTSGLPITAVGLDVTRQVRLDQRTREDWIGSSPSPMHKAIQKWTDYSLQAMQHLEGTASMPLHDPLAVMVAMHPDLVQTQAMHVQVETQGSATLGMTLADRRPLLESRKERPNLQVCTQVDKRRSLDLFLEGLR